MGSDALFAGRAVGEGASDERSMGGINVRFVTVVAALVEESDAAASLGRCGIFHARVRGGTGQDSSVDLVGSVFIAIGGREPADLEGVDKEALGSGGGLSLWGTVRDVKARAQGGREERVASGHREGSGA